MKRQNNRYTVLPKKITGFTLIELLVASALSIIVLIAAGSGFVTTQKLSQVAKGRLQVQNDLRNATNMIVRDARIWMEQLYRYPDLLLVRLVPKFCFLLMESAQVAGIRPVVQIVFPFRLRKVASWPSWLNRLTPPSLLALVHH